MSMLNRKVYLRVKKCFLKLKQPCLGKAKRPSTKLSPSPLFLRHCAGAAENRISSGGFLKIISVGIPTYAGMKTAHTQSHTYRHTHTHSHTQVMVIRVARCLELNNAKLCLKKGNFLNFTA